MAKRNAKKVVKPASRKGTAEPITKSNIEQVEKETIDKVNRTISALETAMAVWDAAREKPEKLKPTFTRYAQLHEVLSRWQLRALRSAGKANYNERVQLLWDFVDLCKTYDIR